MKLFLFVVIAGLAAFVGTHDDPCTKNQKILPSLTKRSPLFPMDNVPICDRYLTPAWYRAPGYIMTNRAPNLAACGTLYPYWLNGTIPQKGKQTTLQVCQVGLFNECVTSHQIKIANCNGKIMYYLKPVDGCSSGYCFERQQTCKRVTGSVQNTKVLFHNMTWTEVLNTKVIRAYDPSINIRCQFTPLLDDSLFYDIEWYIDNKKVNKSQTVTKMTKNDAILSANDILQEGRTLGISIHCVVGVKPSKDDVPCNVASSSVFFAGIKILTPSLVIKRKGKTTLKLQLTVPYADAVLFRNKKDKWEELPPPPLNLQINIPEERASCKVEGTATSCEKQIEGFKYKEIKNPAIWQKPITFDIYNKDDVKFELTKKRLVVRLSTKKTTNGKGSRIFANMHLPDIPVSIVEDEAEHWKGKHCESHWDPHMKTFDGYAYECQKDGCIVGKTYVLYRNNPYFQEVQVQHSSCNKNIATCICAVAIKAGKDVFKVDNCHGILTMDFPICKEKALQVMRIKDKIYNVYLPTGTKVVLNINVKNSAHPDDYINTEVYPSVGDYRNTEGLCGTLDNNINNDFFRSDHHTDKLQSHPNGFSKSWMLDDRDKDNLFTMYDQKSLENRLKSLPNEFRLCTCNNGKTECNYNTYLKCDTSIKGAELPCLIHNQNTRKKRDLEHLENIKKRSKRSIPEQPGTTIYKSEAEATRLCNDAFLKSREYTMCLHNVPNFSNDSLSNCIKDMMLAYDRSIIETHLEAAMGQCTSFISLNSTLQQENPKVAKHITSLCQNNCSNHGTCNTGNCTCDKGYVGSDCSFDLSAPILIHHISGSGFCDSSIDICDDITLYGHYFLENMGANCYFTREELLVDGSIQKTTTYTEELSVRTLVEGYCPLLLTTNDSWITRYHFNISKDEKQFSDTFHVYVYQSACQTINDNNGIISFLLLDGYCFISGSCVLHDTIKTGDNCSFCDVNSNRYDWTYNIKCNESTTVSLETSTNPIKTLQEVLIQDQILNVHCDGIKWNISVDLPPLRQKYPSLQNNVSLGHDGCMGNLDGEYIRIQRHFTECNTNITTTPDYIIYSNDLIMSIDGYDSTNDSKNVRVECFLQRKQSSENHFYHGQRDGFPSLTEPATDPSLQNVGVFFYTDPVFTIPKPAFGARIGEVVFVKVHNNIRDANIKMRVDDCYAAPFKSTNKYMEFYIIKDRCIASQTAYMIYEKEQETAFMFQDVVFEVDRRSLYLFCNVTLCAFDDFSSTCQHSCNVRKRRHTRNNMLDTLQFNQSSLMKNVLERKTDNMGDDGDSTVTTAALLSGLAGLIMSIIAAIAVVIFKRGNT